MIASVIAAGEKAVGQASALRLYGQTDMMTREQVAAAYELILQRPPESEEAVSHHLHYADLGALGRALLGSAEFTASLPQSVPTHEHQVYRGYRPEETALFERHRRPDAVGEEGFIVNFVGCRTQCRLQAPLLPFSGVVEGPPAPVGNTQGETAEWIGVLRAVDEAGASFRMLELGAGYGPWMAATYVSARRRGVEDVRVYGVEGDAAHVDFIHTNMRDNGVPESAYVAVHGAVGATDGVTFWPVEEDSSAVYGGRPLGADGADYLGGRRRRLVEVPVIALDALLRREPFWDLVHIDIQGQEGEVCAAGIAALDSRVRRVVVGTHSRVQDGLVMDTFHKAGWSLENEKPTITIWNEAVPTVEGMALVDGVQVWRNPRVASASAPATPTA